MSHKRLTSLSWACFYLVHSDNTYQAWTPCQAPGPGATEVRRAATSLGRTKTDAEHRKRSTLMIPTQWGSRIWGDWEGPRLQGMDRKGSEKGNLI